MISVRTLARISLTAFFLCHLLLTTGPVWAQSNTNSLLPDTSYSHGYTILGVSDFSAGSGRTGKAWCITSDAESFTARAQTVIEAAIRLQKQHDIDLVKVEMTPVSKAGCTRYIAAVAEYSPEGRDITGNKDQEVWQVKASDISLGVEERLVAIAWEEARPKFERGGEVDINEMSLYLAKQLNLSPSQVKDYWLESVEMKMTLKRYPVND